MRLFFDSFGKSNTPLSKFFITAYDLKKLVLYPRTLYLRYKERKTAGFVKQALELHYYRPSFYKFIAANIENPDILYEHALDRQSVVLDVGAFTGEWSRQISLRYQPTIYAFEPNPNSFQALQGKVVEFPQLLPQPCGLGGCSEAANISLRGLGSSTYHNQRVDRGADWVAVKIVAVDEAWPSLELGRVDLMKINIEGAEFPLLEKMIGAGLIDQVDCFMIQFHEWHPGAYRRRRRIRRELARTHKLNWDYNFVWEKWSKL